MIYTYLDADELCYATRAIRFACNSTMAQVTAICLSCIVEATSCFCPQVSMRIWTPHHIKENYSHHSLNVIASLTIAVIPNTRRNLSINITIITAGYIAWRVRGAFYTCSLQKETGD